MQIFKLKWNDFNINWSIDLNRPVFGYLEINLYDLSIEILKERDIWNQILEMEESVSKEQLKELLQGVLDPEAHLVPAIAAKLASTDFEVLFLSGVGEVFPYIRSHNVLNNLQSTAKEKPTVMFFPGAYTHSLESGASLDLFGSLHDDKYYRAFNIFHCEAIRSEGSVMTLKTIFNKPVDRPIEGVIKADDEASLRLEIEEYVLTNEVEKRLESFLDAYNNYEGANGVWVSGFFGSGKSHLLKMLALLLENRQVDGTSALDLFLPKCGDNEILRGDLKRAVAIPSKSILFNIDQKADVISKTQIDALLAVFVKVFDEMCGYYGKQGHIAQFERDLDSRGLFEQFKSAYESTGGQNWEKGREQALLEANNIAKPMPRQPVATRQRPWASSISTAASTGSRSRILPNRCMPISSGKRRISA